jgi:hypothetical protein
LPGWPPSRWSWSGSTALASSGSDCTRVWLGRRSAIGGSSASGECSLQDPALGAASEAVLGAPTDDQRLHAESPDEAGGTRSGRRHGRPALRPGGAVAARACPAAAVPLEAAGSAGTSLWSPPGRVAASGIPVASVIRWCFRVGRPHPLAESGTVRHPCRAVLVTRQPWPTPRR